jgi:hypothetical protein
MEELEINISEIETKNSDIKKAILDWLEDIRGNRRLDKIIDIDKIKTTKASESKKIEYSLEKDSNIVKSIEVYEIQVEK